MALNQAANQVALRDDEAPPDARARVAVAAARADDVVLDEPLQRLLAARRNVRWTLARVRRTAVRAHALGKFSDLVLATATSPAMLEYLDNAQSAAGRINENYARELMELHTLGVSGGPSGSTLHAAGRAGTGARADRRGPQPDATPRRGLPPDQQPLLRPARVCSSSTRCGTTSAPKTVLGQHDRRPAASPEIEDAVDAALPPAGDGALHQHEARDLLRRRRRRRAALVDRMARTFQKTDGSIAAVLREMFLDRDVRRRARARRRRRSRSSRIRCSSSSRRCGWPTTARRITNYRPIVGWLHAARASRCTDGSRRTAIRSTEAAWTSSGQMVRRFEIARAIGSGNAGLFNHDDNTPGPSIGFPMLSSRLFYDAIEPALCARDARGARPRPRRSRSGTRSCWRRRTGCSGERDGGRHGLSRRDVLKLALARRRASAAAGARHRLAGVRRARRGRREVPARLSARRLRRGQRRRFPSAATSTTSRARRSRCRNPIRPIRTPRSRSRGRTTPRRGACIRRSRTRCCRSGRSGQLAFVPFAGTEDLTRSHFETQDSVESGLPVPAPGAARARVRIGLSQSSRRRARRHGRAGRVHRRSARSS